MTPSYGGTGEPRSTDAGAMAASEAAGENAVSEYAIGQETAAGGRYEFSQAMPDRAG